MGRIKFTFYALLFSVFGCNFGYALSNNEMLLPPANDDCAGATPLTVNPTEICASGTTATFAQATASVLGATCTAQNGADVWYEFTATSTAHTIALSNFSGTPQPMVIVLYEGDCAGLTMLLCSQNNVLNASGLNIGDTYKVKIYFNTTSPSLTNTFLVCVTTPPPPSNNNQTECLITTVNYDFEIPNLTWSNFPTFVNHNVVQGWRTTASDQTMEFWQQPNYENVPAYSGDQFIELNANVVSGVYQDYDTPQSTVFNYGFAHRGRQGTDTCQLLAGPPGGPYTPVTTVSTGNTAWSYNTGTYTVPDNQPVTRFILQSVSSVGGASVGNFLDAISFTANNGIISPNPFYMDCGELVASLEAAGTGTWSAHDSNPSTVTFSDPASNNVDISGFSVQGIYYFDWTTEYCTSTIEVSYTGPYPLDPVVADITYCQGQTAVPIDIPVDEPGYTMLYYLNGTPYSNPTPDTSVVGSVTYYVIQESDAGCQTPAYPLVVTVNPGQDPVTDFTLPEALCTSDGTVTPTTGTDFTTGGTFSAPVEVVIDPDTGEIDLFASTPGTYDITYSVEEDIENCLIAGSSTVPFTINAAPVLMSVTPLELCDDATNDGFAEFDLAPAIAEALNNQTGYTVTVHLTQADAEANLNPQSQPLFVNTVAGGQAIYIRVVEDGTTTDCYTIEEIQLFVHPIPTILAPITNYVQCDQTDPDANDGIEEFDLTTKDTEITGGNVDYTVSYYMSFADADSATNAIANPATYQNTTPFTETIYVRLENTVTDCYSVYDFDLIVNPLPTISNPAPEFHACEEVPGQADFVLHDHDQAVTNFQNGMTVRYFATQGAAEIGDPADELPEVYVAPDSTIYARVEVTATGCWRVVSVPLVVEPAPISPALDALEECDFNLDDVAIFNLQAVIDDITAQLGGDVVVTIHETQDDADFGSNAITNTTAYSNVQAFTTNGVQTLYVRVESAFTVCYDVEELQLIVHPVPEATTPAAYGLCDNGLDDADGEGIFDLTSVESEVLGLLDPAQYSVSYHESAQDAADNASPIATPGNYTSTGGIVYIRVTNNATGCYDVVELELIVHPLPQANQPTPYTLCDENTVNGQPDETEVFDLTSKTEEIIGNQDGINLTFHHTLAEAEAGTNAIANPEAYTNQSTVEAIYVRVTFEATDCYRIVLLDIRVAPLPVLVPPSAEDLLMCDPDGDGFAQFDLEALVEDMVDNGEDLLVTFHETAIDAENGLNPIPNPDNYTNNVAYAQTIYVRVENTVTGCYTSTAYALDLVVVDAPQLPDLEDITLCDEDNNDQDGVTAIDLTIHDAIILDALDGTDADYTIHYFTTEAAAEAGAPRITNDTAYNGADGQVIWVRVEDIATGCYSIATFTLHVNTPLALTTPPVLTICNEALPNDGQAEFDLTVMDNTILGPFGVGLGYTVNYYEPGATTPIANPSSYVNPSNPLTLTVEVITLEGCKSYTTLTIRVLPLPTPNTEPDALVLCDDNGNGDGVEEFDLTLAADDIMDNEPNLVLSYHETYEDADQDINPIADPTAYESGNAIVYVRVEANTGNPDDAVCYQIVELELIVNPLPALGAGGTIPPYAICEQNTDGFATFILSSHIPEILQGAGQDPADYLVRFYFDQAALDAGTALPNQYTNQVQTNQTILVWVQHIESGCIITADLELYVEEAAIANVPADPVLSTCDDDGDNDGMHEFDLSVFDAEILGTQDPTEYSVAYYETIEDAESATNAIPDPSVYVNSTSDVMTIYARVTNDATISGCHDITEITLIVERLPEPVITSADGSDTICVDYTSGDVLRTVTLNSGIPADMGYSFIWYLNGTELTDYDPASPSYEASAAGDYTVEVTGPAPLNCVSDISAAFTVIQSGPASPVGNGYEVTNYFSDNQVITVYVEGHGEYEYRLDEDGMWQTSNVFTDVPAGTHTVYVRDVKTDYACDEIAIEGVSLVDYPHYFTPNGDGYHDTWNIIGLNQPDAKVYIFDRFGKLIKQISATDQSEGWDGTYNGNPLPATDYWFSVTYRELINGEPVEKEFKAHFSLKR